MAGHFFPMAISSKIFYAENMETVGANMGEVSPTIVTCVPRFFEKMYDKIVLQGGVEETTKYKVKQNRILNSFGNKNDDGVESSRIPINQAVKKALKYYGD
mgnify:CR=1 FL=1